MPAPEDARPLVPGRTTWTRFLLFGGAALLCGITLAGWQERARPVVHRATLQAKTTVIAAGRPCLLAEALVPAGTAVAPGMPLLRLVDDRLAAAIVAKDQEIAARQAELKKVEAQAAVELDWRQRELHAEAFETQLRAAALQQQRLSKEVEQIAWKDHLTTWWSRTASSDETGDGEAIVAPLLLTSAAPDAAKVRAMLQEDAAASALETLTTQVTLCEERLAELKKLQESLAERIRISAGVELAQTRLEQAEADRAALAAQAEELTIKAPAYGTLGSWRKQPGDAVAAGETIVSVFDEQQRYLVASIPARDTAWMTAGAIVTVEFPGVGFRQGRLAPLPPQLLSDDQTAGEVCLAVRIEPTGRLWPALPYGTQVTLHRPQP